MYNFKSDSNECYVTEIDSLFPLIPPEHILSELSLDCQLPDSHLALRV